MKRTVKLIVEFLSEVDTETNDLYVNHPSTLRVMFKNGGIAGTIKSQETISVEELHLYELIVGNIGLVHQGYDHWRAMRDFIDYVAISKGSHGKGHRAFGESVILAVDNEIVEEHL